jgi:hypothetical protein
MIRRTILALVLAVLVTGCRFLDTQTGPSTNPAPETTVSLSGVVKAVGSGGPVKGAVIEILDGINKGLLMTTDGKGAYRFDNVSVGNANISASAPGFPQAILGVHIEAGSTLDFELEPPPWSARGTGSDVFQAPSWVTRVRIEGELDGTGPCETLVVRQETRSVVTMTLGSCPAGIQRYQGVHLLTGGVWVETIATSTKVSWTFESIR